MRDKKSMNKLPKLSEFLNMKSKLERVLKVIDQLKALPNCYSCTGSQLDENGETMCIYCCIDDSEPSRYNCPLYERDETKEIVEYC